MRKAEALPGKYFKASDITGPRVLTLDTVTTNTFTNNGHEVDKPVAYFTDPKTDKRVPQGLVLGSNGGHHR
jgi:hypothetical protein